MTAYTELKRRILRNELKPNEYLEEKQLCEMLGISRTPLREALSQLEREQLVVIVPTKGTFVADMSVKTAKDIFQMRHILEPIAPAHGHTQSGPRPSPGLQAAFCLEFGKRGLRGSASDGL